MLEYNEIIPSKFCLEMIWQPEFCEQPNSSNVRAKLSHFKVFRDAEVIFHGPFLKGLENVFLQKWKNKSEKRKPRI